jgi:hypothetical protein
MLLLLLLLLLSFVFYFFSISFLLLFISGYEFLKERVVKFFSFSFLFFSFSQWRLALGAWGFWGFSEFDISDFQTSSLGISQKSPLVEAGYFEIEVIEKHSF